MRSIIFILMLFATIFISGCKKKQNISETVNITGTIYKNCNSVASNETYYLFIGAFKTDYTEITTDANGYFSFEGKRNMNVWYNIYTAKVAGNLIGYIKFHGEELNAGIIRENVSNQLVLKLKTNHVISNLDTIKYAFQYSGIVNSVHGTITKDTIIGIYNQNIAPNLYNDNTANGELKTLWWSLNKTSVGTSDNQVDYTIHGCAGIADTAYIVVP